MKLTELINQLIEIAETHDPSYEVGDTIENDPVIKIASQPSWPMEYQASSIVTFNSSDEAIDALEDALTDNDLSSDERAHLTNDLEALKVGVPDATVYIAESHGNQYLPGGVSTLLGWR